MFAEVSGAVDTMRQECQGDRDEDVLEEMAAYYLGLQDFLNAEYPEIWKEWLGSSKKWVPSPDIIGKILDGSRASEKMTLRDRFYQEIVSKHGERCFICNRSPEEAGREELGLDHNPIDGSPYGILCHLCAAGLGQFKRRPDLLSKAAQYLSRGKLV